MTPHSQQALDLDQRCINTLRTLAVDQVQKANSGHPGTPMGAAPAACCLWQRFVPSWDRFKREDDSLREYVLPELLNARVSVEAASALGWSRRVGRHGAH